MGQESECGLKKQTNMSMEKITYIVRRKQNICDDIWRTFMYIERYNVNVGNLL